MFKFDCHAHVYETIVAIPDARYIPQTPAPLAQWRQNLETNGLTGGVIVQVSFLGTDNSQLCAALSKLDRRHFAGVAVTSLDVSDAELRRLSRAGICGLRWNLVRGANIPDARAPQTIAFFEKLRAHGFHLEIHLEGPRLAPVLPALVDHGVNVVIDHFGLPSEPDPKDDPLMTCLANLSDPKSTFVKFSAHYRTPFDVRPHAQVVLNAVSEAQVIWGSDWPHTQHESPNINCQVHQMSHHWGCGTEQQAIRTLFDLDANTHV